MAPSLLMIDPWILGFSLLTVGATLWMGFRAARGSRTASDFFVAGRGVSVGWNASAISGEYLSAASFMGSLLVDEVQADHEAERRSRG